MKKVFNTMTVSKKILMIPLSAVLPAVACFIFLFAGPSGQRGLLIVSGLLALAVVLPVLAAIAVKNAILSPIRKLITVSDNIQKGDLSARIDIDSDDEISEMCKHYNAVLSRLWETIMQFASGYFVLSSTAGILEKSTKEMSASIEQAALQINSVAVASEEMSTTSSEIAQNCISAAKSSESANKAAVTGESIINETVTAMNRINGIVKNSAGIIKSLGDRSDQIGEVLNLINDIADQTNLLALNAAIEAARAGEHGRGFAVVADEVRKLAEKTMEATKQIGNTIKAMQAETKQAVVSMDEGVKEVEIGAQEAKKSGEALHDILERINTVSGEIGQIAVASEEQTATTDEIANNINQISGVMQATASSINDNARAVSEVATLSNGLKRLLGQFRLSTPEDARKMVEKAADYLKANGKERTLTEINDAKGKFIHGDLFVFAQDFKGVMLAYGGNTAFVGQCLYDAKDADGKYLGRGMIELAKTQGSGWYEYQFMNPFTNGVAPKITYIHRIDDYYLACGVYK